jgi:hypothetical protein
MPASLASLRDAFHWDPVFAKDTLPRLEQTYSPLLGFGYERGAQNSGNSAAATTYPRVAMRVPVNPQPLALPGAIEIGSSRAPAESTGRESSQDDDEDDDRDEQNDILPDLISPHEILSVGTRRMPTVEAGVDDRAVRGFASLLFGALVS